MAQDPQATSIPQDTAIQRPVFPSGQEVYDAIMMKIEPELTTSQLPLLAQKYKNESPEEAKTRQAHYDEAFAEYQKRFTEFTRMLDERVHQFQRMAIATAEANSRGDDAQSLTNLESTMANL